METILARKRMKEFELINRLTAGLPTLPSVLTGVGDDCAVLDLGLDDDCVLLKTDAVVEGVHFTAETPSRKAGRKALARTLSDIAAMAGRPHSALVTLGLPPQYDTARIEQIYEGMGALARQWNVAIVGGETTTNPGALLLSISLLGLVQKSRIVKRSGAQPGDVIMVTGELGGSLLGKHLDFEPRLIEARWLAEEFTIHAMIDLSDGLAGDLRHVLKASGVGAELLANNIPISKAARYNAADPSALADMGLPPATNPRPALEAALSDGEDYELLFTLPASQAVPLRDSWKLRFPELRLTCIGRITAHSGLHIRRGNTLQPLEGGGYEHFSS